MKQQMYIYTFVHLHMFAIHRHFFCHISSQIVLQKCMIEPLTITFDILRKISGSYKDICLRAY